MEEFGKKYELSDILKIAQGQHGLLLCLLALMLTFFIPPVVLLIQLISIYFLYQTATGLKMGTGYLVLWISAQLVPFLGFLLLISIVTRATKVIRKAGFKVGLLGANTQEIKNELEKTNTDKIL